MDGDMYYFTTQEQMLKDIANNQFIEYGQFDGNYYGTKFDTIRQCIRSSRMCILDISPQVINALLISLHYSCSFEKENYKDIDP